MQFRHLQVFSCTPTVTTLVESSAGIAEGGRTGLTALTTSMLLGKQQYCAHL